MRSKPEIKAIALAGFKRLYWPGVGIGILLLLIMAGVIGIPALVGSYIATVTNQNMWIVLAYVGSIFCPIIIVPMSFFGMIMYFGDERNCKVSTIFKVGFSKFWRKLGSMLLMSLMIFGWSLLFYIPGLIKLYAYSMTPYILADCSDVKAIDAITISKRMMKGHKWELFGLQLGFIGWMILNYFTCGILGLFFLYPYYQATMGGYYVELKKKSIMDGVVTAAQFGGGSLDDMSVEPMVTVDNPYFQNQGMPVQPSIQPVQPVQPGYSQPIQPVQQNYAQPQVEADPYAVYKPQTQSPSYDLKGDFSSADEIK